MNDKKLGLAVFTVIMLFSMMNHWKDVKDGFLDAFNGDGQIVSTK